MHHLAVLWKSPRETYLNINRPTGSVWSKRHQSLKFAAVQGWPRQMAALNPWTVKMRLKARLERNEIWEGFRRLYSSIRVAGVEMVQGSSCNLKKVRLDHIGAGIYFHWRSLYCKCCFCDWSQYFNFARLTTHSDKGGLLGRPTFFSHSLWFLVSTVRGSANTINCVVVYQLCYVRLCSKNVAISSCRKWWEFFSHFQS